MHAFFWQLVALATAGISGCAATGLLAYLVRGLPIATIAGKPGKHLWSIIYAIPLPAILWAFPGLSFWPIAIVWLTAAPIIGLYVLFGPPRYSLKDLVLLHVLSYAPVASAVYRALAIST